jgi:Flp pilus assembly protein TadB
VPPKEAVAMKHLIIGALETIGACLLIAIGAVVLVLFSPAARRRRRRRRHSKRTKIDLFAAPDGEGVIGPDA